MKTSMVAIVSAAFLMVLASVGFGIAQAGETHPAGESMKQKSPPAATSPADDQLRKPVGTGSLPVKGTEVQIAGVTYSERVWKGDIDGH
ncbi:MAG: hypothetical protein NCA08_03695 [Deltaproteobacteria bacterium]|nr:hypothetical protein [Candidatus Deferrimicrobium borealis]